MTYKPIINKNDNKVSKKLQEQEDKIGQLEQLVKNLASSSQQVNSQGQTKDVSTQHHYDPDRLEPLGPCCCMTQGGEVDFPDYKSQGEHKVVDMVKPNFPYVKKLYLKAPHDKRVQFTNDKTSNTLHTFYAAHGENDTEQVAILRRGGQFFDVSTGLFADEEGEQLPGNYVGSAFSGREWLAARVNEVVQLTNLSWSPLEWTTSTGETINTENGNGEPLFAFGDVKYAEDLFLIPGSKYLSWEEEFPVFQAGATAVETREAVAAALGGELQGSNLHQIMNGVRLLVADKDAANAVMYPTTGGTGPQVSQLEDIPEAIFANLVDGTDYEIHFAGIRITDAAYVLKDGIRLIVLSGYFELQLVEVGTTNTISLSAGLAYFNHGFAPGLINRWTSFVVFYDNECQAPTYPLSGIGFNAAVPQLEGTRLQSATGDTLSHKAFVSVGSGFKNLMLSQFVHAEEVEEQLVETVIATVSEMRITLNDTTVQNLRLVYGEPVAYQGTTENVPTLVGGIHDQFDEQTFNPEDAYHKPLALWTGSEFAFSMRNSSDVYHVIAANLENPYTAGGYGSIQVGIHGFGVNTIFNAGKEFAAALTRSECPEESPTSLGFGPLLNWKLRSDNAQITRTTYPWVAEVELELTIQNLGQPQVVSGAYNTVLTRDLTNDYTVFSLMHVRHNVEGEHDFVCQPSTTLLVTEGPEEGPGGLTTFVGDEVFTSNTQLQDNYDCAFCNGRYYVVRKARNGVKSSVFSAGVVDDAIEGWDYMTWSNNVKFYVPGSNGNGPGVWPGYQLVNGGNGYPSALYKIMTYWFTDPNGVKRCALVATGKSINVGACDGYFIWVSPGVEIDGKGQEVLRWYAAYAGPPNTVGYSINRLTVENEELQHYNDRLVVGAHNGKVYFYSNGDVPVQSPMDLVNFTNGNRWCLLHIFADEEGDNGTISLNDKAVVGITHNLWLEPDPPFDDPRFGHFPDLVVLLNNQSDSDPLFHSVTNAYALTLSVNPVDGPVQSDFAVLKHAYFTIFADNVGPQVEYFVGGHNFRRRTAANPSVWSSQNLPQITGWIYDLFKHQDFYYAAVGEKTDPDKGTIGENGLYRTSNLVTGVLPPTIPPWTLVHPSEYPVHTACLHVVDCCFPVSEETAICQQTSTTITVPQYLLYCNKVVWNVCYNEGFEVPPDDPCPPEEMCIAVNGEVPVFESKEEVPVFQKKSGCKSCK